MESLTSTILPWLATYALHSTALLLFVAWLCRVLPKESHRAQEWLWRTALLGPILTTSLQAGLPFDPALGRFALPTPEERSAQAQPEIQALALEPEHAPPLVEAKPMALEVWVATAPAAESKPTLAFERKVIGKAAHPMQASTHEVEIRTVRRGPIHQGMISSSPGSAQPAVARLKAHLERPQPSENPIVGILPPDDSLSQNSEPSIDGAALTSQAHGNQPPTGTGSLLPRWSWTQALMGLWTLGGLLGLMILASAWRRLMDRMAGRTEITSGPLFDALGELCESAGRRRRPRLCLSPKLGSPATVGVWQSQICVPALAVSDLSPAQQQAMLGHELAHILRHDPLWFCLYRMVERVFFFQPLNRMARRHMQDLAEYQCDDWAAGQMGHGLDLAQCLTEVATWMLREKPQVALLPMAGQGSLLGHRVRRLLDEESRTICQRPRLWALPLASAVLASAAWALPNLHRIPANASQETREPTDLPDPFVETPEDSFAGESVAPAAAVPEERDFPRTGPQPRDAESLAPSRAATTPDNTAGLSRFGAELDELESWIRDLERQATDLGQQARYAAELQAMRAQIASLRSKQRRLQALLQRLP